MAYQTARSRLPWLAGAVTSMALAATVHAAEIVVPDDAPTIQIAINLAVDDDEIVVMPGTYFETLDMRGKAITLRSEAGPEVTIINAFGQQDSVIHCVTGEGLDTVIEGFTLTGGDATAPPNDRGGGININGASPTIVDCVFDSNVATVGGGLYSNAGRPTVIDSRFVSNDAARGGAVYLNDTSVKIERCVFEENNATDTSGGALLIHDGNNSTISDTSFTANNAVTFGGAVHVRGTAVVRISRCRFDDNFCGDGGSNGRGAGLYHESGSTRLEESVFVGNEVTRYGGAMYADAPFIVRNCSFALNRGSQAVLGGNDPVTMVNCVAWDNGGGPIRASMPVTYSDIEGGYPGTGNIDVDPLFTDAPTGDLRPLPGSPVIDAGNTTVIVGAYPVDFDGERRAVDDPDTPDTGVTVLNLTVDMGAYELQVEGGPDTCPSDLDDSGAIDFGDILRILTDWGPCP